MSEQRYFPDYDSFPPLFTHIPVPPLPTSTNNSNNHNDSQTHTQAGSSQSTTANTSNTANQSYYPYSNFHPNPYQPFSFPSPQDNQVYAYPTSNTGAPPAQNQAQAQITVPSPHPDPIAPTLPYRYSHPFNGTYDPYLYHYNTSNGLAPNTPQVQGTPLLPQTQLPTSFPYNSTPIIPGLMSTEPMDIRRAHVHWACALCGEGRVDPVGLEWCAVCGRVTGTTMYHA